MASAKPASKKAKSAKPSDDTDGANRRRFDRRDTHIVAQLDHNGTPVMGMVTNLSLEGCLFTPRLEIPVGARIKLKLAGEHKAVTATVKAVSDLGVHCLLHAGASTLGRLSVEVDDMALLMLNAGRPHDVKTPAAPVAARKPANKKAAGRKAAKAATKAKLAAKKTASGKSAPQKSAPKQAAKKTPVKKKPVKKVVKKKAAKKR